MHYSSPWWLTGGHAQTIYPATLMQKPEVALRRERWITPDQDFIDIDFLDGEAGKPFLVLFHGLEGSSNSHYARALMHQLKALGWSGAVPHFRGCSGEPNQAPRFYHSGDAQEINWIIRRLHSEFKAANPQAKFFASGVSLGGNALLRWLGESQSSASIVDAACAVSAPLDLTNSGATLSRGFNHIYTKNFLQTLKPKCLHKLTQFPKLFDRERMLSAKNLYEFDNVVTAPLHGYRDVDDYWHRASACLVLNDIQVPTLVLNAQNDPFMPAQFLPKVASTYVTLDYPQHGGHVGFAQGSFPGKLDWLPEKIITHLQAYG
ncbi:alpha/beta fold hydrolase [Undibacterium amnicola]|uniref:Alpha/beta fold hydrolase n=1 Tax=Undibacterium amnicola TaxID=1834038 RepID=A0ABR6XRS5_9BURK|nr:alpha/beta fold hydrolase [Undibacterium amnicola]MBC3831622.1 alpha/beta fold hydrolase [Undibacterium amnicola]